MIEAHIREALRLRRRDPAYWSDATLAQRYRTSVGTLRAAITVFEARQERRAAARERAEQMRDERMRKAAERRAALRPIDEAMAEYRRRMAALEVADTRDFTGRMLGDPLPGRSALDEKRTRVAET